MWSYVVCDDMPCDKQIKELMKASAGDPGYKNVNNEQ